MPIAPLDEALIATYEVFDVPADRFIGNPELTGAFLAAVAGRVDVAGVDPPAIMRRLVNLRKNGRLPRLRRNFNCRHL